MTSIPPFPAAGTGWAVFLDFDGTLVDLAPTPDAVVVPAGLTGLLESLWRQLGGALALVSGRALSCLDALIPGQFDAIGSHGLEWRHTTNRMELPQALPTAIAALAAAAPLRLPGVLVENKPAALGLHYRAVPALADTVRGLAAQAVAATPGYRIQEGHGLVEILPNGPGKGGAIERVMVTAPYAGRRALFAGDDLTDESAFAVVNRMGGMTVQVGARPGSQARHRLAQPADMRQWLEEWSRQMEGRFEA